MKKNVASQVIGAQMVSASDGSAFTGTATVVITVDGGTQSASGGTGPTHEGNGFHSYIPTQAETNGDHVAFTFTGSGAVPVTIQVYTTFPQTGDSFARLGAPAGASVSADIAAVDTVVDAILVDTAEIGAAGAGLTEAGGTGDQLTALATAAALATVDTNVDAILVDTGTTIPGLIGTPSDFGSGTSTLAANLQDMADNGTATFDRSTDSLQAIRDRGDAAWITGPTAAAVRAEIDSNSTQLAAIVADTNELQTDLADGGRVDLLIDGIKAVTDALPDSGALTSIATAAALATVDGNVDTIVASTLSTGAAAQLEQNLNNCMTGTASGTPTTTSMISDIAVTVDDQFKGRIITFDDDTTTAALRKQSTDITACTAASNTLTFTALTTAPVSGDTFTVT